MIMENAPLIGINRHRIGIDGEGVTTLVAFNGCPLRCKYCLNPQSLHPEGIWKQYNSVQLYGEVKKDEIYFMATHGGITFGGGEPCLKNEFICDFRELCGPDWQLTVETSLHVPQKNLEMLLPVIDCYIIDIKDANNDIYREYTGKNNEIVFRNLRYLIEQGKSERIIVRTPLIPSYNTKKDVEHTQQVLKEMGITRFDQLTYITTKDKKP